jgi:hypothetical protein
MLLEIIPGIGYRGDAALRIIGICIFKRILGHNSHPALLGYLQGETHPGNAGTDYQEIIPVYHRLSFWFMIPQIYTIIVSFVTDSFF